MTPLKMSVASAVIAGLLTGGVMKLGPDALADRPTGPQILVSGEARRAIDADGWYADTQMISSNGEIPEYVLGTDWTQVVGSDAPVYEDYTYEPVAEERAPTIEEAAYPTTVKIVSAPDDADEVAYPSEKGDILGGLRRAPAPAKVVQIPSAGDTEAS